jgi:voltage-gated potassium channel
MRRMFRPAIPSGHSIRRALLYTASLFVVLVVLHVLAMLLLEGLSLQDALWLTLTTATTVGYGDLSAATPWGRTATVLFLYFGGIAVLANLFTHWNDYRFERRERMLKGQWIWNMDNHIVIINAPAEASENFFVRLIGELRHWDGLRNVPVQILSEAFPDGLPARLREMDVTHYHGDPDSDQGLAAVNAKEASHLVVLAEEDHLPKVDSTTLSVLDRLQGLEVSGVVIVECVDDANRARFARYFPRATILRPNRAYPEMLARALAAPGTEKVLENLFSHTGDHPRRYQVALRARSWRDIALRFLERGYGTPLAYVTPDQRVVCNPAPTDTVEADALIVMVREAAAPPPEAVAELLAREGEQNP